MSAIDATQNPPSMERRWNWSSVVTLSFALAIILGMTASGVTYHYKGPYLIVGGATAGGTLCVALAVGVLKNEWQLLLKAKEGEAFQPEKHKDIIKTAIEKGITLKWEGKPMSIRETPILPNMRIGPNSPKEEQLAVVGDPEDLGDRTGLEVLHFNWTPNVIAYIIRPDSRRYGGLQSEKSYNWINRHLANGGSVLITMGSGDRHGERLPVFKSPFSAEVDAGIIAINYLKKLTGLSFDTVRHYVEKQLGYTYPQEVNYPHTHITWDLSYYFALNDHADEQDRNRL